MNKKIKIITTFFVILVLIALIGTIIVNNSEPTIKNNFGNETNFIVETQNCNNPKPTTSEDFLVPIEYKRNGQFYTEKLNETHGYYCWWDPVYVDDLNESYLEDNCNQTSEKDKFKCEQNFTVEV